jgi:uncharacterized protein YfaP (DUF2135 family)
VTMSWNSDNTDVDLWVIEPDGVKCFYGGVAQPIRGELSADLQQGYGPGVTRHAKRDRGRTA